MATELPGFSKMRNHSQTRLAWRYHESDRQPTSHPGQKYTSRAYRNTIACTNQGPPHTDKAIWINLDRQRWAQRFDIPVRKEAPSGFPANTLQTQRALCALELLSPQHLPAAIDALYNAYWVTEGDTDINSPAAIHSILKPVLGDELAGKVMARIGDADVKKRLLENTEWAVEKGAFGLPWYICTNGKGKEEVYWGFDHLKMIADSLGLEGELKSML